MTAQDKQNIVLEALSGKSNVTQLAQNYGISRKAIYSWIKSYQNSPPNLKQQVFKPRYVTGEEHPRSIAHKAQGPITKLIVKNPAWGSRRISRELATKGINLGYFGVNSVLKKIDAETPEKRKIFVNNFSGPGRLGPSTKYNIVKKNLESGIGVSKLAQEAGVSRKTIYEWINKYQRASDRGIEGSKTLRDSYRRGENHPRAVYPKIEQDVLDAVIQNPQLSAHSLSEKISTSVYTIWKILDNYNLGTYQDRLAYAKNFAPAIPAMPTPVPTDRVRSVWEQFVPSLAPAPPPSSISFIKTSFISLILTFFISLGILTWIRLLTGVSSLQGAIGYIFSGLALTMGMLFFLYSLKYYLTLAIVLSFSQGEPSFAKAGERKGRRGILYWILGIGKGTSSSLGVKNENGRVGPAGLEPNLDRINLERYPFISIQIPFYNEKNVVERAIAASTGFDYKGEYEVILCDDSTDETSTIIKRYQQKFLGKGESLKVFGNSQEGWTLSAVEVSPGVTLKHLQRTSRSGFKGGALREALRHTDPRAEFVSVFDADFVPYPDTLTLFLKYFQVTAGTLYFKKGSSPSNIAAVQGYQWHVLNKSENWITRGVRSEYAGSYVIERSGEEIYGGLKQISGSVYMIRKDVLQEIGWENSITEDFELTLKLYNAGYKVVYTPYIQAPAECVSTIKRLIRQRMRWAEGHSQNVKKMFRKLIFNPKLTLSEKLEFLYLSPYYLQALFFLVGTFSWLISETVFKTHLPFWTELWGWSLVLTNLLALPLMNAVGLFLEESEEKDYAGLASFVALSSILVPFQAYASLKGFLESSEGPWFRTPKTGRITDIFTRGRFYRFIQGILPGRSPSPNLAHSQISNFKFLISKQIPNPNSQNPNFGNFRIRPRRIRWVSKATLAVLLVVVVFLNNLAFFANTTNAQAADPGIEQQINIIDQEYSTTSTSSAPTDNSLGYIYWDSAKYSGTRTINLDIVGRTSATSAQMIAALFDDSGGIVSQSKATIGNANKIATLDGCPECNATGEMIYTHSIVLDSSGYPVISYIDNTNKDLKLIHCGNVNCTSGNVITTVDGCSGCSVNGDIDKHSTMVLNSSGYPVIAYNDTTNSDLRLVVCDNQYCNGTNTYKVVDNGGGTNDVGSYAFLRLAANDRPVITYFDATGDDLEFAYCNNATCTSPTLSTLYAPNSSGQYNSFELDTASGTCTSSPKECPVIAFREGNSIHALTVLHCGTNNCSSGNQTNIVDDGADATDSAGIYASLKLDSSGFPVISFGRGQFGINLDLKIAHCNDVNCDPNVNGPETVNILDGQGSGSNCASATGSDCDTGDVGWYNKLELDSTNGYPIISYRSQAAADLKVIHCNDANCSGNNDSVKRVDGCPGCDTDGSTSQTGAGGYGDLTLDSSGYPVISYRTVGDSEDLKVVHCGNADCNPTGSGQVDPTNNQRAESMVFTPNLTGGSTTRNLTVRVWVTSGTGYIRAARLRIIQNDATNITDSQTQVELGDDQTITATSYGELTNPKYYLLDRNVYSGTWGTNTKAYFEASLKGDGGQGNGRVWSSGAELGDTTGTVDEEWSAITNASPIAGISIQSTTKNSGTYAAKVYHPSGNSNLAYYWATTNQTAPFYYRFYLNVVTDPSATRVIYRFLNASNQIKILLNLSSTGTLELFNNEDSASICTSSALNNSQWYRVEIKIDSTTIGATVFDARLGGTSFGTCGNQVLNSGLARIQFGSTTADTQLEAYFDDFAINDSTGGWPGPGHIIHLKPNEGGDNAEWTKGGTSTQATNWEGVDEVPPNEGTDLNYSHTIEQVDDLNVEDSSLASNDDVNVVSVGVRFNGAGASANDSFVVRVKDSSGGAAEGGTAIAPSNATWKTNADAAPTLYPLTIYDLPGSSTTKWTDSTLDTAQIGYRLSSTSSNAAQVSTVWMLVDYTLNSELSGISAQAKLQQCADTSCSWADVASSTITSSASTFQRVRTTSDISSGLTDDYRLRVVVQRSSASGTIKIANAKLIIEQSETGGITKLELIHQYVNSNTSETATSLTAKQFYNEFDDDNFVGGTFNYYYEATMYCTTGCTGTTDLYNGTSTITNSSVNTTSETPTWIPLTVNRTALSSMPTTATNLDTRLQATSGDTTYANTSWLIIQVSGLQVPENLLIFLPLVLFIPIIINRSRPNVEHAQGTGVWGLGYRLRKRTAGIRMSGYKKGTRW